MGYEVRRFEQTPNPNAVKCVLDRTIASRRRSYFRPEEAAGDSLAEAIFSVGGVTNVLLLDSWLTVTKAPDESWRTVKSGVRRVLRDADEGA